MDDIGILIVEDEPQIAEIQRRFIEKIEGFKVVGIAHSLDEADDLLEVLQPKLILLDVHFPTGSGLDLLRSIRSTNQEVDVILITAATDVTALQEAMRGGVFDYILKPLVFDRLHATLLKYKEHVEKFHALRSLQQSDVDHLLPRGPERAGEPERLPKGIDQLTLEKVQEVFGSTPDAQLNAQSVGEQVGASRSTARRYLEFLVSCGQLRADVIYGSVGRPERLYSKLNP